MTKNTHIDYSIVIPVYESSESLLELVDRLHAVMGQQLKSSFEVIVVDDGSTSSETAEALTSLCVKHSNVIVVILMRNYGKSGAVLCGFEHAKGNWIITMDDDLQQLPEDIPLLLTHKDHDVVVANFTNKKHDFITRVTSTLKSKFDLYVLGLPCKMSPLKLIKSEVVEKMITIKGTKPFIPALLSFVTKDIVPVTLEHSHSVHGKSRYSQILRLSQFFDLLIGNSAVLLRTFGLVGVLVSICGFIVAGWLLVKSAMGDYDLLGLGSLVVINLIFGGFVLTGISLVGEYLYRILEVSNNKPAYMIRKVLRKNNIL